MDNILFFDGVCVMCNGLVRFVLRHDKHKRYKFATLQGETAQKNIPHLATGELASVVLMDESGIHTESDAIISLLSGMPGIFKLAKVLKIFPKALRDAVYRWIAKNRYRFFGQTQSCGLLSKAERERILD